MKFQATGIFGFSSSLGLNVSECLFSHHHHRRPHCGNLNSLQCWYGCPVGQYFKECKTKPNSCQLLPISPHQVANRFKNPSSHEAVAKRNKLNYPEKQISFIWCETYFPTQTLTQNNVSFYRTKSDKTRGVGGRYISTDTQQRKTCRQCVKNKIINHKS